MKIAVLDNKGQDTGRKIDLAKSIYEIKPNNHAVYLDVKQYLANQRQGTHKSKEKGEIKGSTRKLRKQKGSGAARVGSIKSPVFRGGGRIFGPTPRDYSFKLNKSLKKLARKSAFSMKAKSKDIVVLENFDMDIPKTKEFLSVLKSLKIETQKSLFVLGRLNKNVYLSSRNLSNVGVVNALELNTYSIVNASKIVLFEDSLEQIENILGK